MTFEERLVLERSRSPIRTTGTFLGVAECYTRSPAEWHRFMAAGKALKAYFGAIELEGFMMR